MPNLLDILHKLKGSLTVHIRVYIGSRLMFALCVISRSLTQAQWKSCSGHQIYMRIIVIIVYQLHIELFLLYF